LLIPNPDYPASPQPEIIKSIGNNYNSITQCDYVCHIHIPETMFTIDNLFNREYCQKLINYLQFKDFEVNIQKMIQETEKKLGRINNENKFKKEIYRPRSR